MARLDHAARVELVTALVRALAPSVAPDGPAATRVADRAIEALAPVLDDLPDRAAIVAKTDEAVRRAAKNVARAVPATEAFGVAAAAAGLPARYRVPRLLSGVLGLPAARVAKLLGADEDETETALLGAKRLHERELGESAEDSMAGLADAVTPDVSPLGTDSGSGPLPFGRLAAGLVVVILGVGVMVFLAGDGAPPDVDPEPDTAAAAMSTPREEEPAPAVPTPEPTAPGKTAEPEPKTVPYRPTAVKPSVSMLLPNLLLYPNQVRLERVWAALEENPRQARDILARFPTVKKEVHRIPLLLALAVVNDDPDVRNRLNTTLRESGSAAERRAAAAALGHVPGKDHAVVPAAKAMAVRSGVIEDATLRGQLLAAAAAERDPAVLGTMIQLLGPSRGRDRAIEDRLFELARSPSAGLRRAAIEGLRAGREGDQSTLGRLIADSKIPAEDRARLVPAYARHDDREVALGRLAGLIESSKEIEVREAAVQALGGVSSKEARAKATAVLENAGNARRLRMAALGVLAREASDESRAALTRVAEGDEDEAVRGAAKELLRALSAQSAPENDGNTK